MIKNVDDELRIMMLQLQRSALIDTQTLFQLLIEKGICSVEEITQLRQTIELNNEDVARIDNQIADLQGVERPNKQLNKTELKDQLRMLLKDIGF